MITAWLLLLFGTFFSALYSGLEIGAYSVNRLRLRLNARKGYRNARWLDAMLKDMDSVICTILCGNNLSINLATVGATILTAAWLGPDQAEAWATLLLAPPLFVLGELLPKMIVRLRPNELTRLGTPFLRLSRIVFAPLILIMRLAGRFAQWISGRRRESSDLGSLHYFQLMRSQSAAEGVITSFQDKVTQNILTLKSRRMRDLIKPLNKVAMVSDKTTLEQCAEIFKQTGASYLPVYGRSRQHLVGVIDIHDAFFPPENCQRVQDVLIELPVIPEGLGIERALLRMRQSQSQLAVVTTEQGHPLGIIVLRQLVESIVGSQGVW